MAGAFGRRDVLKLALAAFATSRTRRPSLPGGRQFHYRPVDNLYAELRTVRAHPASLHQEDRYRGSRGRGGHWAGLEERTERRWRRGAGALPAGRGEVRRRRLGREALSRYV